MSLKKILSLVLLSTLTQFATGKDASVDELFKQLQTAVADAVKEVKESDLPQVDEDLDHGAERTPYLQRVKGYIQQTLQGMQRAIATNDQQSLSQQISSLNTMLPNEKIQKITGSLQEVLRQKQEAAEQAYVKEIDDNVDLAVKKCLSAKEPAELDAPLMKLARIKVAAANNYAMTEVSRRSAAKADAAVDLLCRWQDYMMQQKSENYDSAYSIMDDLAKNSGRYPFIQRSELLQRTRKIQQQQNPETEEFKQPDLRGKTLKDLPELIKEAEKLKQKYGQRLDVYLNNLNALQSADEAYEQNFVGWAYNYCLKNASNFASDPETEARKRTNGLRDELLLKILPAYLELDKPPAVEKDESPAQYLQRVASAAREREDWITAWKALTVYREVAFNSVPAWLNADLQGLSLLNTARNQEKAGLYFDAIIIYKRIAALSSQNLPIDAISQKLSALKKDHPADFEAAEKMTVDQTIRYLPYPPAGYPYSR